MANSMICSSRTFCTWLSCLMRSIWGDGSSGESSSKSTAICIRAIGERISWDRLRNIFCRELISSSIREAMRSNCRPSAPISSTFLKWTRAPKCPWLKASADSVSRCNRFVNERVRRKQISDPIKRAKMKISQRGSWKRITRDKGM